VRAVLQKEHTIEELGAVIHSILSSTGRAGPTAGTARR